MSATCITEFHIHRWGCSLVPSLLSKQKSHCPQNPNWHNIYIFPSVNYAVYYLDFILDMPFSFLILFCCLINSTTNFCEPTREGLNQDLKLVWWQYWLFKNMFWCFTFPLLIVQMVKLKPTLAQTINVPDTSPDDKYTQHCALLVASLTIWNSDVSSSPYLLIKYWYMSISVCRPIWSLDFAFGTHSITPHWKEGKIIQFHL